jgi:gliding motility-associated-like protein
MVKKIIFAFLLFPLFLFSQTFTNSLVEPAGSWNTSLTKTITVSGLPNLQNGVFELNQVNLHLGDDANTRNYFSYRIVLQKGALVIELVATNGLPNSIIRQIDTKFRYNNVLKRLFEHGGTTQPFHIGYYRSQDDFSAFNGIDPNGDWTITITESSGSSGGKFNKIDLVFGVPLSINSQISTTTYDSCSTPLCVSSNEITIATNDGFTPQVSDMFNGNTTGCSWNAAQNNSSWFRFTATQASAKITISGISGNIQILGISPGSDNNICTPADNVVITGGCPDDVLNDSYFSPQYINGSTRNNQLNLSGLVTGQEYYFIVDGTGGAISPFYIEMEGANQSCNCFVDTPVVNTTPASCSSNSISTIINYDALLNYTFSPVGPTIGVGGFISNMNTGVNYTLIASNGSCSSTSSASFSNFDQLLVQPEPTINSVAASCSSAGSSTISNYDASNTYTFTPVGPTIGAAGVISGMTVGISYTVTATNGSCTSLASISFSNAAQLSTPTVPTITSVAANCSSNGSSIISNYDASNTYAFTPAGPIVDAAGVITGMIVGTSYLVIATNGSCISLASASFSNAAQIPTPAIPTITSVAASCSSAGSSTISNYNAPNTYTFTPAGPTVGAVGVISGMSAGTSYTVTATNSSCTSLASLSFSNALQLPTPIVPTITSLAASCLSTGSSTISNYDVSNSYTFSPTGPSVGATGVISGMTVGTIYTVTATNGGCTSLSSVSFSNAAQLESPIVSITHGCNGISYELSAIVELGVATYEWFNSSLVSLGSTPTISITNPDTYEVRVSLNGCSVIDFVTIDDAFCMIPKGISPNNDGDNDTWDLSGLNVQKAQIFNRYGVEVYSRTNYTNQWDGRTDSGEELPTATYYYVLTFPNGVVKTGWVYLNRVN